MAKGKSKKRINQPPKASALKKGQEKSDKFFSGEDFKMSLNNAKFRASLPFALALVIYIGVWAWPAPEDFQDPWYKALKLLDSSQKAVNPEIKNNLLEKGGARLKSLAAEHPYHARVHHYLGVYYSLKHNWDSAIIQQNKAIGLGSGGLVNNVEFAAQEELAGAMVNKANIHLRAAMDTSQSVPAGKKAAALDSAAAGLKKALETAMGFRQSQRMVDLMRNIQKNLAVVYMNSGNLELQGGDLEKAAEDYRNSLAYIDANPNVHYNLGLIYQQQDDLPKAAQHYEKALRLNPKMELAKRRLEMINNDIKK